MTVQMVIPAKDVSAILLDFIKDNLPFDITVRTGKSRRGQRRVCFSINGSTQEDILAKIDALEAVIYKYQLRGNIEQ